MRNLTKAQAVKAYLAICKHLDAEPQPVATSGDGSRWAYCGQPVLVRDWDWTGARWTVVFEEGPYDWPIGLSGGYDETSYLLAEVTGTLKARPALEVPGVMMEPVNSYAVGLYPA